LRLISVAKQPEHVVTKSTSTPREAAAAIRTVLTHYCKVMVSSKSPCGHCYSVSSKRVADYRLLNATVDWLALLLNILVAPVSVFRSGSRLYRKIFVVFFLISIQILWQYSTKLRASVTFRQPATVSLPSAFTPPHSTIHNQRT
jgi:hypothetical protein